MAFKDDIDDLQFEQEEYAEVITKVNEDIIIDNIINQIEGLKNKENLGTRQSLFKYIDDRFIYLMNKYGSDPDKRSEIRGMFDDILDTISNAIEDQININIEYSSVLDMETKFEYVHALYNFFVIDLQNELVDMIFNYVIGNKDQLTELIDKTLDPEDRKNLSYQYIRKDINNKYTPLIYYLDTIIETLDIPNNEDIIEFMTIGDEDELSNSLVNQMLVDNIQVQCDHKENLVDTFESVLKGNNDIQRLTAIKLINELK